jgi:hypothetical protein
MKRSWMMISAILIVVVVSGSLVTCAQKIRSLTYGPDLAYFDNKDLTSVMAQLAVSAKHLEKILSEDITVGSANSLEATQKLSALQRQAKVVAELKKMHEIATSFSKNPQATKHPIYGESLDHFLSDLSRAQRAVDQDPPNYFWAGTITGSCATCHLQHR